MSDDPPSAKVTPIRPGVAVNNGEVDERVVKALKELLEEAKSGQIIGIAYVTQSQGDYTQYCDHGRLTRGAIGALHLLLHEIAKRDVEAED